MTKEYDDPDNDPEVIRARADAKAKILEARSKLHPLAQFIYTLLDEVGNFITNLGCLIILGIVILAIFAPSVLHSIFGK